jgi:phage terminase large subunit-like protein
MNKEDTIREIDRIQKLIKKAKEEEILAGYRPRSFHWDYIMAMQEGVRVNAFVASNQSGKTYATCALIKAYAEGFHRWVKPFAKEVEKGWDDIKYPDPGWWFKERYTKETTYKKIMEYEDTGVATPSMFGVAARDFKVGIGKTIWPKLSSMVPGPYKNGPYVRSMDKMQGKIPEVIHWNNGSETHFFSAEQDDYRFESSTWDGFVFDEPPKQSHYVGIVRGTRVKKGAIHFSLTPLSEPWLFDTLLQDAKKPDSGVRLSTCNLFSEEVDWMANEDKEALRKETERKDPHEVEARIYGKFTHLLGRIYPTYNEDVHLISKEKIDQMRLGNVTYGVTIDPHDRRPSAVIFWFVTPNNDIYIYKEYPNDPELLMPDIKSCDLTIEQYSKMIKEEEATLRTPFTYRLIDPNKGKTPRKTVEHAGQTLIDDFAMYGLYFDGEINDKIHEGHREVRNYLHYDPDKPVDFKNSPKLYISEDCWNAHTSMLRYTWDEKKSKELASEVPHEKWKDFADTIRYTCIKKPVWLDPTSAIIHSPELRGSIHNFR